MKSNNNINFNDDGLVSILYTSNVYNIHIDKEIGNAENYRKVFDLLQQVSPYDFINVIINTPGGDMHTALQLYSNVLKCHAFCTAYIYRAYSAGAIIALACNSVIVEKFGSMMIHTSHSGYNGKTSEINTWSKFSNKFDLQVNKEIYSGFLTEKEIDTINNNCDIWLTESEINQRLKKWKPNKGKGMV